MEPTDPNPTPELHGLDPGELLARGMHTVKPSGSMHDWTPPTPEELARLLPQYRIESMLGRGGMGAVYKGFQEKLGRAVAIKLLPAELTADQQFVTRFQREAKTLAKLQHPGIVSIHDFGQTGGGHLYFVMEYVEGTDLQRVLQGPGLQPEQALEIITQICEALHAAHLQGVIHRDIKPANILLTTSGRVKLADFGLARPDREENEGLTLTNIVLGTPDYMAPEQREGHSDPRADIYALGVMLYEMLTGQLPRGAWTPPSRKVQVDVRIDEVVIKALQQEPDLRYQQASEMKTDVDSIRSGPGASPAPKPPRRAARVTLLAAAVALAALAAAWALDKSRPASTELDLGSGVKKTSPVGPDTLLREIEYLPSDSGLKKFVYTPVKPGYGLVVRYTGRPEIVLDETAKKIGYNETTVWEWIQAPGEGWDNTIVLVKGSPLGGNPQGPANSFSIWLSQALDDEEDDEKTILSAEQIPYLNLDRKLLRDRVELVFTNPYTYDPKNPERDPPWLRAEIKAVPYDEIKAKYPEMRNPENLRVDYVDGKNYGQEVGKFWRAKSAGAEAYQAALSGDAAKSKASAEKAIAVEPDNPWNRINYGWCLFTLGLYPEALAAWRDAYQRDPAGYTNINVCLALATYKIGDEKEALHLYSEQVKRARDYGKWDSLLKTTDDWQPKSKETLHELYKKWSAAQTPAKAEGAAAKAAAEPPLAPGEPKLKETRIPMNEYGLRKSIFTPTRSNLGLVIRYTANPAFIVKGWKGIYGSVPEKYTEDLVYEWAFKPDDGENNTIQVMDGIPMWHSGDADENGYGGYTLRVSKGPTQTLLEVQKFPSLHMDWDGEWRKDPEDHVNGMAIAFKNYKNNTISLGDPGETWLKVEITALPIEELEARYPELRDPNHLSTQTIDGKPASEVAKETSPAAPAPPKSSLSHPPTKGTSP